MRSFLFLAFLLSVSAPAGAKVFSFKERTVAAYLRGSGVLSQLGQDAFVHAENVTTVFGTNEVAYEFSGEAGVQFSGGPFNLRFGFEILRPKELSIQGKTTSDVPLYDLTSTILSYGPTAAVDFVYSGGESLRFYGYVGAGYYMATLVNKYDLTAQGEITYAPNTSHSEKGEAFGFGGQVGLGFETVFVDNSTISVDFGYRHLVLDNYRYTGDVSTMGQGAQTKGAHMKNIDGSARKTDLGGLTLGMTVRFYIF